jgi:hypothetical protein
MGEEKPDEELMGKRKSSPRLSTASLDADNCSITFLSLFIPPLPKMFVTLLKLTLFYIHPLQNPLAKQGSDQLDS